MSTSIHALANDELEPLNQQFLSSVWHEVRSPLGCIKGYASSLLLSPEMLVDQAVVQQCLKAILEASAEIEDLVDHLLDLSRIRAGSFELDLHPVELLPLVESAIERLRVRAQDRQIVLHIPSDLPLVHADPRRLAQVLDNLLDNASKYATAGAIGVSAYATGAEVRVSVVDQGPGIPPDELDSIFEHFRRGRAAAVLRIQGTGIGLAICRGIIEAQGGRIWVESRSNGHGGADTPPGATLSFSLRAAVVDIAPLRHPIHSAVR